MIRAIAVALVLLLACAVSADQPPDGFGPNPPPPRPPPRSAENLGLCFFMGFVTNPAGEVFDAWSCTDGVIVLFPTPCTHHPKTPCKET
jgi:hypothetical protein